MSWRVVATALALCLLLAICAGAVLSSEPVPTRVTVGTAGPATPYQGETGP